MRLPLSFSFYIQQFYLVNRTFGVHELMESLAWDKSFLLKIQLASHAGTRNLGHDQCNGIFAQWVESVGVGFCQKALVTAALEPLLCPLSFCSTD